MCLRTRFLRRIVRRKDKRPSSPQQECSYHGRLIRRSHGQRRMVVDTVKPIPYRRGLSVAIDFTAVLIRFFAARLGLMVTMAACARRDL